MPKGGIELHGHFIEEGTTIGVNAWVMNRNKDVFGPDVDTFRPERWTDATPEQLAYMKKNLLTVSWFILENEQTNKLTMMAMTSGVLELATVLVRTWP